MSVLLSSLPLYALSAASYIVSSTMLLNIDKIFERSIIMPNAAMPESQRSIPTYFYNLMMDGCLDQSQPFTRPIIALLFSTL